MAGTQLRLLHCKAQTQPFRGGLLNDVGLVADDHGGGNRIQRAGGPENMFQKREFTCLMKDLGQRGLHPRALTGREDDDVRVGHDPKSSAQSRRVGVPGVREP